MKQQRAPLIILAVVVVALALAFLVMQRPAARTDTKSGAATTTTLPPDAIALVSAADKTIVVRNAGTQAFRTSDVVVYLDNIIVSCLWDTPVVSAQQTATCTLQGPTCSDKGVRVVGPSNEQRTRC